MNVTHDKVDPDIRETTQRLKTLEEELEELEREYSDYEEQWKAEKAAVQGTTHIKEALEQARRFIVRCWQSHAGGGLTHWQTGWRYQRSKRSNKPATLTWGEMDHLWAVAARLKRVQIERDDAFEVIHDGPTFAEPEPPPPPAEPDSAPEPPTPASPEPEASAPPLKAVPHELDGWRPEQLERIVMENLLKTVRSVLVLSALAGVTLMTGCASQSGAERPELPAASGAASSSTRLARAKTASPMRVRG